MGDGTDSVVEWAWERQSVWSQMADRLKAGPSKARWWALVLTVAISATAVTASQVTPHQHALGVGIAIAGALAAGLLAGIHVIQGADAVHSWTRARSVSEQLKTEVYLYLCHAGRYDAGDGDQRLRAEVNRMESDGADLLNTRAVGLAPAERDPPVISDVEDYLEKRVRVSQITNYYSKNAGVIAARLRLVKGIQVALSMAAAALTALAAVSASIAAWAAVVTTASTALLSYAASERLEFLLMEYNRTASELRRLAEQRAAPDGSPLSDKALVEACENVISVQNQGWMAKWGSEA